MSNPNHAQAAATNPTDTTTNPTLSGYGPGFTFRHTHPSDVLYITAAIVSFLSETTDSFHAEGGGNGLSETSCFGLQQILFALEISINEARRQQDERDVRC